jgi:RND family efflux transporter MFP subunit
MSKTKRRISIFAALVVILAGVFGARFLSQQKEPPRRKPPGAQAKQVDTLQVHPGTIPTSLEVQGELAAYDKIDIFAEVSGTLESTSRPFKVGSYFPKGSVLISVDQEEARLNLLSQRSSLLNAITQVMPDLKIDYPESHANWQEYLNNYEVEASIKPFPEAVNQQEKYFIASRNLYSQYYNIKSAEERLKKYLIKAPFSGVITAASINPGAVVRAGQKLGELMSTGNYELVATVPMSDLKYIGQGSPVTLYSEDISGEWKGRVKRVNNQVEAGTQTVKVFIELSGQELKEGMYMRGEVEASKVEKAIEIPRNLLIDQKAVYVVRDSILSLEEVQVVKITPETAIIRGVTAGAALLSQPLPGAYNGMKVTIRPEEGTARGEEKKDNKKAVGSLK